MISKMRPSVAIAVFDDTVIRDAQFSQVGNHPVPIRDLDGDVVGA